MKFGVVIFPGSNCDQDTVYVLREILDQEVIEIWHKEKSIVDVDVVVLPGGFSYGDYLRSGAIARFSPVMDEVITFAKRGGFVLGICNGFQTLCEAGLLPGALLPNTNQKFICKNVYIVPENNKTPVTAKLDKNVPLKIPIAHGEGRYFAPDEQLARMRQNGQILFRYCNRDGEISEQHNPNGSMENIAGICNEEKNVYGMMPHPERAADDLLGNTDGRLVLESLIQTLEEKKISVFN
ncbi:MAG: phosphoribosylformylglycinamidine synthase subunit PurQ [Chlorobi bacterium]|nr:phosphoribosylformylglycinamidine synthase subunit PurQ [Chlorobiota bacterium]